jgi:two-component system NtrC family sensor kinase
MAAPLRTLSARILLGFAALIVTFGITTVLIVTYMDDVGVEIGVIRTGYLKLALTTKDLSRKQDDLRSYLSDDLLGEASARRVEVRLRALRLARDRLLAEAQATLAEVSSVPSRHGKRLERTREDVTRLAQAVGAQEARYARLLAAPPLDNVPADVRRPDAAAALAELKAEERAISVTANNLAEYQERSVTSTAKNLEYNEARLRVYTIVLGTIAVLVGLLITVRVTLTLRPLGRLREGARRIGSGALEARIEERGPAEVADLAREFNAMARAVDERQRELVRAERLATIGKMAAMVTHEVRNPLSSIALNTELLGDELAALPASPQATEATALCAAITREVDRLTAITEEYLTFARLPKPSLQPHVVGELAAATAQFMRSDLSARGVTLHTELAAATPTAMVDAGQLRQCLINLLRNAAEAMAGQADAQVTIGADARDDGVVLWVADNGPGIEAGDAARLFDPFYTTKLAGTGLGLAVTQQIVRDHGGRLTVESAPGQGARFSIWLPTAPG